MLLPPIPRRPLILYLTILDESKRRSEKKRACYLLLEQKIHKMGTKIHVTKAKLLCIDLDYPSAKAIYVKPYHLVSFQDGPDQVYF